MYYFLFIFSRLMFVVLWHHFSTIYLVTTAILICYIFTLANWISMTIWVLYQDIFIYLHIPMIRNDLCKESMKERNICCSTFTFDKDRLGNNIWSMLKRRNENEKAINIEMPFHTEYLFQMNCKIMKVL